MKSALAGIQQNHLTTAYTYGRYKLNVIFNEYGYDRMCLETELGRNQTAFRGLVEA